jgi:ABC-2 type transport system permease protein
MNRTIEYAKRNLIELARDPLGYVFCIAFPIVMLIVMSVVNESIPKEANMTVFRIDNLAGGIIIFGQTFVMLFTAILVATDRGSSFLTRLFSSPMKSKDFTIGYILPMILIGAVQGVVTGIAAIIIAGVTNYEISLLGLLTAVVFGIPSSIMFISIGLFFGTILNEKSAPGLCSVIISLGTFMGGVFFDAEGVGGAIFKVCKCLPFIYCTRVARCSIKMDFSWDLFGKSLVIVSLTAVAMGIIATLFFNAKMKADK